MKSEQISRTAMLRVAGLAMTFLACVAWAGCSQGFAKADRVVSAEDGKLTIAKVDGQNEQTHEVATDAEVVLDGEPALLEDLDNGDAVKLTTERKDGVAVVKKIEAKSKEKVDAEAAEEPVIDPLPDPGYPVIGPLVDRPEDQPSGLNAPNPQQPLPETDQPIGPEDGAPLEASDPYDDATFSDAAYEDADTEQAIAEVSFFGTISSLGDNQFVIKDDSGVEHTLMVNDDTLYTLNGNEATFDQLMEGFSVSVRADMDGDNYVAKMIDAISDDAAR